MSARSFGYKETRYAKLFGRVPHVGAEAWFHEIFKSPSREALLSVDRKFRGGLPSSFKTFLQSVNGLILFSDTLAVFGIPVSYARRGDDAYQPYSLLDVNQELPANASDTTILIGRYSYDGSNLCMGDGPRVWRCSSKSIRPLYEWPSLENMIESEIDRLSCLFDATGHQIGKDSQLVPKKTARGRV